MENTTLIDPREIRIGDLVSFWGDHPREALAVYTNSEEYAAAYGYPGLPDGWVHVVTHFDDAGNPRDGKTFAAGHKAHIHNRRPVHTYDVDRMAAEMFERDMERTAGMEWSVVVEIFGGDSSKKREYVYRSDMDACFLLYDDYKRLKVAFGGEVDGNGWYFMARMPDGSVHFVTLFAGGEQYDGVRLGNLPA